MAATTLVSAVDTEFTPSGDKFAVDVTGGAAVLRRSNTTGGTFTPVGDIQGRGVIVDNAAAGSVYKLTATGGTVTVLAYE